MLKEYSILMMLLIVAASFIGMSSIYQYAEGQSVRPPVTSYAERFFKD
jgi:hypothetical protein